MKRGLKNFVDHLKRLGALWGTNIDKKEQNWLKNVLVKHLYQEDTVADEEDYVAREASNVTVLTEQVLYFGSHTQKVYVGADPNAEVDYFEDQVSPDQINWVVEIVREHDQLDGEDEDNVKRDVAEPEPVEFG